MENVYDWNEKAAYLQQSRRVFLNSDYLEFLVQRIWLVDKPVRVADFGCGSGYLGSVLMPLLPRGSSYTGYDSGEILLEEARTLFEGAPFDARFISCDLVKDAPAEEYDMVICQAFLMHIPEPARMLQKMMDAVKAGGMVICLEPDWNVTNAAMYIDGLRLADYGHLGLLQKLWKNERETRRTDKCVGTQIPAWMAKLGLQNVGVRMNDCVRFANPYGPQALYQRQLEAILAEGWGQTLDCSEAEFIEGLCRRGATREEGALQYRVEQEIHHHVASHRENLMALMLPAMFIAYGWKAA